MNSSSNHSDKLDYVNSYYYNIHFLLLLIYISTIEAQTPKVGRGASLDYGKCNGGIRHYIDPR